MPSAKRKPSPAKKNPQDRAAKPFTKRDFDKLVDKAIRAEPHRREQE